MSDPTPVPVHAKSIQETMESAKEDISVDTESLKLNIGADTESLKVNICADTESLKVNICADTESLNENIFSDTESLKENTCADTESLKVNTCSETEPLKENTCSETEPLKENICVDVDAAKVYDAMQEEEINDHAALMRQKTYKLLNHFTDAAPWSYAFSCASLFLIPLMQCIDVEELESRLPTSVSNLWYTQAVVIITIICLNILLAVLLCVKYDLVKVCLILNATLMAFYYVVVFILYVATLPYDSKLAMRMSHITCAITFPTWIIFRSMAKDLKVGLERGTQAEVFADGAQLLPKDQA